MVTGQGRSAHLTRTQRLKAMEDDFKCTWCKPHRGENERNRDGKWRSDADGNWGFHPSKSKDRK